MTVQLSMTIITIGKVLTILKTILSGGSLQQFQWPKSDIYTHKKKTTTKTLAQAW